MKTKLYTLAQEVKILYKSGAITKKEAMEKIKPYADYYNETAIRLAEKYNQRAKLFSFASFMR